MKKSYPESVGSTRDKTVKGGRSNRCGGCRLRLYLVEPVAHPVLDHITGRGGLSRGCFPGHLRFLAGGNNGEGRGWVQRIWDE